MFNEKVDFTSSNRLRYSDLHSLMEMIHSATGIVLTEAKTELMSARLRKRMRALSIPTYREYMRYLNDPNNHDEYAALIDVMTTNTTQFFREPHHFQILEEQILPDIVRRIGEDELLRIWSAGCSLGAEPYTLAMVLARYFGNNYDRFSIIGTDISRPMLQKSKQGIYPEEFILDIVPKYMQHLYLMRGKDKYEGHFRVVPEIRDRIEFRYLNLIESSFNIQSPINIIFCRNVTIYFNHDTRVNLMRKFYQTLEPGGYLFIGHSETLNGINTDFKIIEPTVYQKPLLRGSTAVAPTQMNYNRSIFTDRT